MKTLAGMIDIWNITTTMRAIILHYDIYAYDIYIYIYTYIYIYEVGTTSTSQFTYLDYKYSHIRHFTTYR